MMLTPIPPDRLPEVLARFAASLAEPASRAALRQIAATAATRAAGARAKAHRQEALALARRFGIEIRDRAPAAAYSWDGRRLRADTEAYVLLHEIAHYQLAAPARRQVVDFGLGPGPDTGDRAGAERRAMLIPIAREREEAMVSLLGILWEAALGQPALASFLDQNWLEGAGTQGAARHFTGVLRTLRDGGFLDRHRHPTLRLRRTPDRASDLFLDGAGEARDVALDEEPSAHLRTAPVASSNR